MEYFRQIGALNVNQVWQPNIKMDYRRKQMSVISDMMSGYEAVHAKNRWKSTSSGLTDDAWYRMYVSFNYFSKVINELKMLAPYMDKFNTEDEKKTKILKRTLDKKHLNWRQLLYEIYVTLETKGDFYAYYSTSEENKVDGIPVLKVLKPECMEDIILDTNNQPIKYIYKERVWREDLDESTGTVNIFDERDVTTIYAKGYIRVNDPIKYAKTQGYKIFYNSIGYENEIRLIHIPSFKKQGDKFSIIPSAEYVDPSLLLAKIDTNRDIINDHLGFPFPFIIGGRINTSDSQLIAGGAGYIDPESWVIDSGQMPQLIKMEINGELESIEKEKADAVADLYKKVSLIRESLEETLSGSDSSRNISQLRLGIEQKNRKYYENIADGLKPYFKSVLRESGLLTKKDIDKDFTFQIPDVLVNNSIFDDLLVLKMKRELGESTLTKEMKEDGYTEKDITERKKQITEEINGGADMSFMPNQANDVVKNSSGVAGGSGLDNNFK